jgi:hypothetical protein
MSAHQPYFSMLSSLGQFEFRLASPANQSANLLVSLAIMSWK